MLRAAIAALMVLVTAGCIVSTPYPESWPEPDVSRPACQTPSGSFDNLGTWASGDELDPFLLADLFFPLSVNEPMKYQSEREAVTRVVLHSSDNAELLVRAYVGADVLFERTLPTGPEHCEEGQFTFDQGAWNLEGSIGAVVWGKMTFRTSLDRQGGLLLRGSGKGGGVVFMVVPVASSEKTWWRFPPLTAGGSDQPYPPAGGREPPTEVWQLLPPETVPKSGSYAEAERCLKVGREPGERVEGEQRQTNLELDASDLLTGSRTGGLATVGWHHPEHGWIPGSHDLRVRKQHWESPDVGERYLACLLARGFRPERRSLAPAG